MVDNKSVMSEALFVEENKVAWCAARTCTKGRGRCYIQVREASVTDNTGGHLACQISSN